MIQTGYLKHLSNSRITGGYFPKGLRKVNPYNQDYRDKCQADGYYRGYGRYAIDVLIPAFIAAYTGQDPKKVALINQNNPNIKSNPFRSIIAKTKLEAYLQWS